MADQKPVQPQQLDNDADDKDEFDDSERGVDEVVQELVDETLARPSFASFWKRTKDSLTPRTITFMPAGGAASTPESLSGASNAETAKKTSAQEKAQARRAQVRKAQIQHRQRKENYVKQLEMDVAELRASIAKTQQETQAIIRENDAIRAQIQSQTAASSSIFLATSPTLAVTPQSISGGPGSGAASEMDLALDLGFKLDPQDLDDITMSLAFDEAMGLPSYRMSNSPPSHYSTPNTAPFTPDPAAPAGCSLTPSQTQEAINFILALEHNCRDHFLPSYNDPSTDDPSAIETGHVLMATSLGLRTAPDPVFREAARTGQGPWSPVKRPDLYEDVVNTAAPVEPLEWQAPDLTLQNLYGLACAVNSASELEITPVQAWFELAARFPMELLLRREVLDELKKEFVGVVKCPHYGAQIEREAFESIVGRVLGPVMEELEKEGGEGVVV